MANQGNQKEKLLFIMDMLQRESDQDHVLSSSDIIRRLEDHGFTAERKSVYRDLAVLEHYGMDILKAEDGRGFYLGSRDFELPELKLLVDAVSASKFISEKKSRQLLGKIEKLASKYEGKTLQRQVVVPDRVKSGNENIYYNIDTIYSCINLDRKMQFHYYQWDANKKRKIRNEGAYYVVSPAFLLWQDENYYLVAYADKDQAIRHYRVDKMMDIAMLEEMRSGKEEIKALKKSEYTNRTFGMYAGNATQVTLVGDSYLANVLVDRFGSDISMHATESQQVIAHVNVEVSPQFYGWLVGLGSGVQLKGPKEVRQGYQDYLREILSKYDRD